MVIDCLKLSNDGETLVTVFDKTLNQITIPNSVREIARGAFSGCASIERIDIPNSVLKIGSHAFKGCIALKNVTI